jgi:RimJ/RimL family protein N-acetyltransferase
MDHEFTIKHFSLIGQCPDAVELAVMGWLELIQKIGDSDGSLKIGWDHRAIVAQNDGLTVGVMTWSDEEHLGRLWINLSFVRPDFRRRKVHTIMFQELVEKAKELGRRRIGAGTFVGNKKSLAAMKKQGRILKYSITEYEI